MDVNEPCRFAKPDAILQRVPYYERSNVATTFRRASTQLAGVSFGPWLVVLGLKPNDEVSSFSFFGPVPDIRPIKPIGCRKADNAGEIRLPIFTFGAGVTHAPIGSAFELQHLLMAWQVG